MELVLLKMLFIVYNLQYHIQRWMFTETLLEKSLRTVSYKKVVGYRHRDIYFSSNFIRWIFFTQIYTYADFFFNFIL
jgi:hypothetical protein